MSGVLERAIKSAGGPAALAKAVGVTSQAVSQWKQVPAKKVLQVEELTGIPRFELRPDVFGQGPRKRAA